MATLCQKISIELIPPMAAEEKSTILLASRRDKKTPSTPRTGSAMARTATRACLQLHWSKLIARSQVIAEFCWHQSGTWCQEEHFTTTLQRKVQQILWRPASSTEEYEENLYQTCSSRFMHPKWSWCGMSQSQSTYDPAALGPSPGMTPCQNAHQGHQRIHLHEIGVRLKSQKIARHRLAKMPKTVVCTARLDIIGGEHVAIWSLVKCASAWLSSFESWKLYVEFVDLRAGSLFSIQFVSFNQQTFRCLQREVSPSSSYPKKWNLCGTCWEAVCGTKRTLVIPLL